MKCPVCKDKDLVMSDRQGIEIDYCPNCRGIWLDRGELDKLIERSGEQFTNYQPKQQHHDDYKHQKHYKKKSMWGDIFDF